MITTTTTTTPTTDCNDIPALVDFRVSANLSDAAAKGLKGGVDWDLQVRAVCHMVLSILSDSDNTH